MIKIRATLVLRSDAGVKYRLDGEIVLYVRGFGERIIIQIAKYEPNWPGKSCVERSGLREYNVFI